MFAVEEVTSTARDSSRPKYILYQGTWTLSVFFSCVKWPRKANGVSGSWGKHMLGVLEKPTR